MGGSYLIAGRNVSSHYVRKFCINFRAKKWTNNKYIKNIFAIIACDHNIGNSWSWSLCYI